MTRGLTRIGPLIVRPGADREHLWIDGAELDAAEVRAAALDAYQGEPLTGALRVAFTFYRPRPAGHFGSGRNAGTLRAAAPASPLTRPDVLKLSRAVEDSLTGIIYRDDAQIVHEVLEKRYGSPPRCEVAVWLAEGSA